MYRYTFKGIAATVRACYLHPVATRFVLSWPALQVDGYIQHGQHATCGKRFSLGQPAFGRTWPAPSDPSELARLRARGGTHRRSRLVCPGAFGAPPAAKQHAPAPPSHRAAR